MAQPIGQERDQVPELILIQPQARALYDFGRTLIAPDNDIDLGGRNRDPISIAPLMRPAVIRDLLQRSSRRVKLITPVFVDHCIPEEHRENPYIISAITGLITPDDLPQDDKRTAYVIQSCAVGYPRDACVTPAEALNIAKNALKTKLMTFPNEIRLHYYVDQNADAVGPARGAQAPPRAGEGVNAQPPAWFNNIDELPTLEDVAWLIQTLANSDNQKTVTISIFTTALLAYCKQGTVSMNVINKVTNAVRDELGININILQSTVRSVWNVLKGWINPNNARKVFAMWESAIGDEACLRLKLIVNQAGWTGMTNFVNIKNARERYPDFNWPACAKMFPQEFINYRAAIEAVNDDKYYGYNRDLGAAKSTNYTNLCYVAYALLMEIGGERTLRDFQGTNRNTPFASQIDTLVRDYANRRNKQEVEVGDADIEEARRFLGSGRGAGGIAGIHDDEIEIPDSWNDMARERADRIRRARIEQEEEERRRRRRLEREERAHEEQEMMIRMMMRANLMGNQEDHRRPRGRGRGRGRGRRPDNENDNNQIHNQDNQDNQNNEPNFEEEEDWVID